LNVKIWAVCLVAALAPYKKVYHDYHRKRFNAKFRIAAEILNVRVLMTRNNKAGSGRKLMNNKKLIIYFSNDIKLPEFLSTKK